MARPNLDYDPVIINVKLCLHPDHDDDLVAWFDSLPERGRATAVITRLRTGAVAAVETATISEAAAIDALASLLM